MHIVTFSTHICRIIVSETQPRSLGIISLQLRWSDPVISHTALSLWRERNRPNFYEAEQGVFSINVVLIR